MKEEDESGKGGGSVVACCCRSCRQFSSLDSIASAVLGNNGGTRNGAAAAAASLPAAAAALAAQEPPPRTAGDGAAKKDEGIGGELQDEQGGLERLIAWLSGATNATPSNGGCCAGGGGRDRRNGDDRRDEEEDDAAAATTAISWKRRSSSRCCCAARRGRTSLLILNAIRDGCRPFLEESSSSSSSSSSSTTTTTIATTASHSSSHVQSQSPLSATRFQRQQQPNQQQPSYEESFPALGAANTAASNAGSIPSTAVRRRNNKPKRRIRPAPVSSQSLPQSSFSATGNLSDLPSSGDGDGDHPWNLNGINHSQLLMRPGAAASSCAAASNVTGSSGGGAAAPQDGKKKAPWPAVSSSSSTPQPAQPSVATPVKNRGNRHHRPSHVVAVTPPPPQQQQQPPPGFSPTIIRRNNDKNRDDASATDNENKTPMQQSKAQRRRQQQQQQQEIGSNGNESKEEVMGLREIKNLSQVYCTLVRCCLVPSSAMEVELLLYLVGLQWWRNTNNAMAAASEGKIIAHSEGDDQAPRPSSPFSRILSTPLRCHCFGVHALSSLSSTVQMVLGSEATKNFVSWQPLRVNCPSLCRDLEDALRENEAASSLSAQLRVVPSRPRTALLALPFNEERDSRHNFKTLELQATYKNREQVRDAFLYQLRAFLGVRGKVVDAAEADRAIGGIRRSVRGVVDMILDSNLPWFCEFFCEMLLQVGLVPLEETDSDVLKIANHNKDKLQKLHRRFSSKTSSLQSSIKSTRKLVGNPKREASSSASSPSTEAQKFFPGHQEFFFLFLMSADSYKLGSHLKVKLVSNIKKMCSSMTAREAEKQVTELCVFARFLGALLFSPNWQSTSNNGKSASTSACGLRQLEALGLSLTEFVLEAWKGGRLISVVPWTVDILKLTTWDESTQNARSYHQLVGLLRQIQVGLSVDGGQATVAAPSTPVVLLYLETLFGEIVGIAHCSAFQGEPFGAGKFPSELASAGEKDICLDASVVCTESMLVASNTYVEELHDLASKMVREHVLSLRSPGASRRLRPSAVPTTPTVAEATPPGADQPSRWEASYQSIFQGTATKSDTIQAKLQEAFFHQHHSLKDVCEYVGSSAVKAAVARLQSECVRPLLNEKLSDENSAPRLEEVSFQACLIYLKKLLEKSVGQALRALASPDVNSKVLDMAELLTVSHALRSSEGMVKGIVSAEVATYRSKMAGAAGKRLFDAEEPARTNSNGDCSSDAGTAPHWFPSVTRSVIDLNSELDLVRDGDMSSAVDPLRKLVRELDRAPTNDPKIPPDVELRSFFQSIMVLDGNCRRLLEWVSAPAGDADSTRASPETRWSVLSELLAVAVKVKQLSCHGLRTVGRFVSDPDSSRVVVDLGSVSGDATSLLARLLVDMAEARVVDARVLEEDYLRQPTVQEPKADLEKKKLPNTTTTATLTAQFLELAARSPVLSTRFGLPVQADTAAPSREAGGSPEFK